jgi:hypothetical protein
MTLALTLKFPVALNKKGVRQSQKNNLDLK